MQVVICVVANSMTLCLQPLEDIWIFSHIGANTEKGRLHLPLFENIQDDRGDLRHRTIVKRQENLFFSGRDFTDEMIPAEKNAK